MKPDQEIINDVFDAALRMGRALKGLPTIGLNKVEEPNAPDRPRAVNELADALQSLKATLGCSGETHEELARTVNINIGHRWKRESLQKIIAALALIQKNDQAADQQALELLGQVVLAKEEAEPGWYSPGQITDVWPTRPLSDSEKA